MDDTTFKRYELRDGDILFARTGSLGRTFLYSGNPSEAVFASYLIRFSLNKSIIEPLYLFYYTHSKEYFEFIEEKKHTVSQPNINAEEYKSLLIPLPPLFEQKRIAANLKEMMNEIDNARLACEKQLEAAKALPSAYLREVFERPEARSWPKKKLGEVCEKIVGGGTPSRGRLEYWGDYIYWLSPSELEEDKLNYVFQTKEKISEEGSRNSNAKIIPPKSVLLSCTASVGKVAINIVPLTTNQQFNSFVLKNQMAVPEFIGYYLIYKKEEIKRLGGKTTFTFISKNEISNILIPLPPLSEQKRIAEYLKEKITQAEKLQAAIEKELETINSLPQSILSKAFRGEL